MRLKFSLFLVLTMVLTTSAGTVWCYSVHYQPQEADAAKAVKILTDPIIWRSDFQSLLANLQPWTASGETAVAVFATEAVGSRKFTSNNDALHETSEFHAMMFEQKPRFKPEVLEAIRKSWTESPLVLSPVGQRAQDDGTLRVNLTSRSSSLSQFLAPDLTIETVKERAGEPERVSTYVVDRGDERRPIIITAYHYAGGTIQFGVSDRATKPGLVDRVVLDTSKLADVLFVNPRPKTKR